MARLSQRVLLAIGCAAGALAVPAGAVTLRDALAQTYRTNPTIAAARAGLRATDEDVGIARAAGRIQGSASGQLTQSYSKLDNFSASPRQLGVGANLSLPIYSGGRVGNSTRAAIARVDAGRADLRATEGDTFTEAVGAYMDVIRDSAIVELNTNNVKVLVTNLEATRDRFQVGDVTRTDVAQSEARLSGARTQLSGAQSQLVTSQENYLRVIGALPVDLQPPPPLPPLPETPERAATLALDNNPALIAIAARAKAAGFDIKAARGARLPTLAPVGSGQYFRSLGGEDPLAGIYDKQVNAAVGLQATIPLYQGGIVGAQVRRAQEGQSQLLEQQIATERQVIANARAAFASYHAALAVIASSESAVRANTLALEGARAENSVGTRTVLDVLNAEQELLNSQVQLVGARRDAYVAGFALINAIGRAEARDLGLEGGPLYDPATNYDRVSRRRSDWSEDATPAALSTRTTPDAVGGTPSATVSGPPAPDAGDDAAALPPAMSPYGGVAPVAPAGGVAGAPASGGISSGVAPPRVDSGVTGGRR